MPNIYTPPSDTVLAHYGVKGMRWGKRKGGNSSSSNNSPKSPVSDDAADAKKHSIKAKTSGTDALSNKELQAVVTRMNLEQQYSKLNTKTTNHGKDMVKKLLADNAKQLASQYAQKGIKLGLEYAISSTKK